MLYTLVQSTLPYGLATVSLPSPLLPLPSSISPVVTTSAHTTITSTTGSKKIVPLRARSRSRSSSRSQSPSSTSPQMGGRRSPPKEGHPLLSPKRYEKSFKCLQNLKNSSSPVLWHKSVIWPISCNKENNSWYSIYMYAMCIIYWFPGAYSFLKKCE